MKRRWTAGILVWLALLALLPGRVGAAAPNRQDPYPAPPQPTADPLTLPLDYPVTIPGAADTPATIGAPAGDLPVVAAAVTPPSAAGRGLIYLWLGFIATLLIFLASVIGATMLFNRRVGP